ncbi:MAG TPA: YerC/YecD family TrpR-related protein [Bacillota bacterium]|nr:YerC/YecD family TrpR-related protein [Bacillota bacterium]
MYISKVSEEQLNSLYDAILSLETQEECAKFLKDLTTVHELEVLSQRLEVARLLEEGHTYKSIEEKTQASTATISRVKRTLENGDNGYKLALKRTSSLKV